ncbi:FAD-dependent oxidoreductase [Methylobacterium sp. NMS14P]|uniref:NAD(P)/FAD-dependent oxidoreductase n=1 Tax=Methylobacterium sp. NMS14P TaxID=2894310 RepID=UPI00235946D2|nr:FAD-dependent oxidoreductase [Methylobacterium sp. NMS14P]WCS23023.1 FAD-dependent oxidoreductase [Methylobacterium sp. NMS14P]
MVSKILVIGGGFAGLWAAAAAARARTEFGLGDRIAVTVIAPDAFHDIRVRCYETDLSALRVPLDDVLGPIGVDRREGRALDIDPVARTVTVESGAPSGGVDTLAYDRLILAAGSVLRRPDIPGIDGAFDVDTFAGAQALSAHLGRLGDAGRPDQAGRWTAVVIGGGLVGLELACELPARLAAARSRAGGDGPVRTILIDQAQEVGSAMGAAALPAIRAALSEAGVTCIGGARVDAIDRAGVRLADGTHLPTWTSVCATGMQASPLGETLGLPRDPLGRVPVDAFLAVRGLAHIYAAGDIASAEADDAGHRTVMSCQHARPMGRFAGFNAVCDLAGRTEQRLRFAAPDYVTVLDLGAWGAVYTSGWDRGTLVAAGAAAKATKRIINGTRIYPPLDRDAGAILAAAAPIIQAAPATQAVR